MYVYSFLQTSASSSTEPVTRVELSISCSTLNISKKTACTVDRPIRRLRHMPIRDYTKKCG
jgi:hypothetical protein